MRPPPPTIRVAKALVYGPEDQLLTTSPVDGRQRLFANDWATFTITVKAADPRSRRQRRRGKAVGSRIIERIDLIDNAGTVVYSHPLRLELPDGCEAVLPITVMCQSTELAEKVFTPNGGQHCAPPRGAHNTCFRFPDGSCPACGFTAPG